MKLIVPAMAFALAILTVATARANDIKPAIVFDLGGKFDRSFNEGVADGADRFTKETGIKYVDFVATNDTQFEQAHRRFAERDRDPIIGVGFAQADAVAKVAKDFPKTRFTLIDGVANLPNVQSVLFKERGVVPGRHRRGHGIEKRQGRLCRRHGHSADTAFCLWL